MPEARSDSGRGDEEPLLGRAGDASQQEDQGIQLNFVIGNTQTKLLPQILNTMLKTRSGTAVIAQVGIWILTATIWASVFIHPLILFSAHPLLNSAGILLSTQAVLILQPTHTPKQKRQGANIHAALNTTSILTLLAALVIIEYNKISHGGTHFESPHAILGLITYILFFLQAIVGIAQYYTPKVFGSVDNAKSIYKYHRMSGYVILTMSFVTVAAATQTSFNKGVLHIQLWAVVVAAVITLVGVLPRIKKQKLGF
ncbi:MAG: hypothetical protein LQ338_000010 [Usnochroma carphineum]|nr:MAG: hypothetical protein LQ338_000010 [Usnochroma carphineum]